MDFISFDTLCKFNQIQVVETMVSNSEINAAEKCEDTGLLEIQILLCFTTAYLQAAPARTDHGKTRFGK